DELAHVARAFADAHAHRRFVAQAIAGADRVRLVQRRAVIVANRRRDPALRVAGVALSRIRLRQDEHAAGSRHRDRRAPTGAAATEDEEGEGDGRGHGDGILSNAPRMTAVTTPAIDVPTPSRIYKVTIADGALDTIGRVLDEVRAPARRFVVSSPLVWRLHG